MSGRSIWAVVAGVLTWNENLGPRWYAIALVVLAIPQCWLGGRIFEAQSARSEVAR